MEGIFQTTIRLIKKNSHLSPFSSSSVAEATIEEKEKTFEMILSRTISSIRQNIFSDCCLLLLLLTFFMEYRFFVCEDIILKYLASLQKTLLWTAQL